MTTPATTTGNAPYERIGFSCAYTPLALIQAAGFVPHRILPVTEAPDQAGTVLHDNLCPHVKRILDRALYGEDLPELAGTIFVNSCDAMRRLADAWRAVRPAERQLLLDLPVTDDDLSVRYFQSELGRMRQQLSEWAGREVTDEAIATSIEQYNELYRVLAELADRAATGTLPGGPARLQQLRNRSVTEPMNLVLAELEKLAAEAGAAPAVDATSVPVFLFGNVLPNPEAAELFQSCGARVVHDDLCTGARQLTAVELSGSDPLHDLAKALLRRPACARTVPESKAGSLARQVATRAEQSGARGVIAHVMKFCDPYLARLPAIRDELKSRGLPVLTLEGDCTLRSLGQHRTRIEAFVEMLQGDTP
ncbi:MAG: 2-hydroxyacyl-CoA dehydratase [Deltaproteobacteria bacterium]|nr:2-hydroxyacyl-CoA dehydratase [Deltaproteobacteria bacterium]